MIKLLEQTPDFMSVNGEEIKQSFMSYRGVLINPSNREKITAHEGVDE